MINELLRQRILGLTGDASMLPPERLEGDGDAFGPGVLSDQDKAIAEQLGINPDTAQVVGDQQLQEQIEMAKRMLNRQYQEEMKMLESTMPIKTMPSPAVEAPTNPRDLITNLPASAVPMAENPRDLIQNLPAPARPMAENPRDLIQLFKGAENMSPEEQASIQNLMQRGLVQEQAPMMGIAQEIAAQGEGEDTQLAHLKPGEVVLPPEFFEDDRFEAMVESKFKEIGVNPEEAVVGTGIATLNPITGLEQFGFFKKIGKSLKKVVKKVAPIAAFIPGVGTALGGVLGGIGGLASKIPVIGGTLGKIGSTVAGGIAKAGIPGLSSIAGGTAGGFSGIVPGLTNPLAGGMFGKTGSTFAGGPAAGQGLANKFGLGSGTPSQVASSNLATNAQNALNSMTPTQLASMPPAQLQQLQQLAAGGSGGFLSNLTGGGGGSGGGGGFLGGLGNFAKTAGIGALAAGLGKLAYEDAKKQTGVPLTPLTTMSPTGRYNIEAEIARRMGQETPNPVEFGLLPANTFPELSGGKPAGMMYGGAVEDLTGGMAMGMQEGGGIMAFAQGGAVQMQDGGGIDSLSQDKINKYLDELSQKKQDMFFHNKFPTTLVSKQKFKTAKENYDNAARYVTPENLAKYEEGGMDAISSKAAKKSLKKYLNSINAKKMSEGGGMNPGEFPRMDGDINGPGTETSDDIPAMLSDGEFVMTGQAVRGAGSYEMQSDPSGIISLMPTMDENRERGMDNMYAMMDTFASKAKES